MVHLMNSCPRSAPLSCHCMVMPSELLCKIGREQLPPFRNYYLYECPITQETLAEMWSAPPIPRHSS